MPEKRLKRKLTETSAFYQYTSMGFQMLGIMAVFVLGGIYLDRWVNIGFPLFTLIFSLTGVSGAIWAMIRKL